MRIFGRAVAGAAGTAMLLGLTVGVARADYTPSDVEPFLVGTATVATVDSAPHARFTVNCAGATNVSPPWVTDGSAPTCPGGQLTILVTPSTHFYQEVDSSGAPCHTAHCGTYAPSDYAGTLAVGVPVRVGGYWARQNYDHYEFEATYVWDPGSDINDPPPNPAPSTPQDFDFSRRYVVDASVSEIGTFAAFSTAWSDKWGMVLGNITNYYNNPQVQQIAAYNRDSVSLDPRLKITTNDAYPASTVTFAPPLTRYWIQRLDPADNTYKYYAATKAETVTQGAQLRVAGAYGWGPDADWRFLAYFVWRPAPLVVTGGYVFNVSTQRSSGGPNGTSNVSADYSGSTETGDGQVNPAGVTLSTSWSWDNFNRQWVVTGSWRATHCVLPNGQAQCADRGTISGTFSGNWNSTTGQASGTVLLSSSNGLYCGVTGGGTFATVPGDPDVADPSASPPGAPPLNFDGAFNLKVSKDPAVTC
ncbi:MAG: hypothetical protein ACYDAD_05285 [Acidimicrobiales bacterium]